MHRKPTASLSRKLIVRLLPTLVLFAGAGLLPDLIALHFSNKAYDRWLYDSAFILAQQVHFDEGRPKVSLPKVAIDILEWDSTDDIYYAVGTASGSHVFGSTKFPPLPASLQLGPTPVYYDGHIEEKDVRIVALSMEPMPGDEAVVVRVAETRVKRDALTHELLADVVVYQFVTMGIALILIWLGIRGGLRPLTELASQIKRRSPVDLSPFSEDAPAEVKPLVQSLNGLLQRLNTAQASQKRFIADASHQLRTPLSALKVQAAWALRQEDPAAQADALMRVNDSIERVIHVAQQLLALAKADPESEIGHSMSSLDLAVLAQDVTAEWVPKALAHNIDLGYSGPGSGVGIHGESQLLSELLSNLIDNALSYAGAYSSATVGVTVTGTHAVLSVEDSGPGIPPDAYEKIFERFFRLPKSGGNGCGLGLAIVKEIAKLHGADVAISSGSKGKGTRIGISFRIFNGKPAAQAEFNLADLS